MILEQVALSILHALMVVILPPQVLPLDTQTITRPSSVPSLRHSVCRIQTGRPIDVFGYLFRTKSSPGTSEIAALRLLLFVLGSLSWLSLAQKV